MEEEWSRTVGLIGEEAFVKLSQSHVAVFGVGGVGGYVAEGLARAGVGTISLIDSDTVELSNINRQLIALHSTVGEYKTEAMKKRILDINPEANVIIHNCFFLPETKDSFDFSQYSYVVDAVDTVTAKIQIIEQAKEGKIPVISAMGAGNKLHPEMFEIADLSKTSVCPLAKVMRYELKKRGICGVKVVYSKETPVVRGNRTPASIVFVPSVAGMLLAGEVIRDLTEQQRGMNRL